MRLALIAALLGACVPDPCGPPPDQTCGGVCINTAANDKNCGACGAACASGQGCCASICTNLIAGQCPEVRN